MAATLKTYRNCRDAKTSFFATFIHKTLLKIVIIVYLIVSSLIETKQHKIGKFRENSNLPSAWQKQL